MKSIFFSTVFFLIFSFSSLYSQKKDFTFENHTAYFKSLYNFRFGEAASLLHRTDTNLVEYHFLAANYFWWIYLCEASSRIKDSISFHLHQSLNRIAGHDSLPAGYYLKLATYAFLARLSLFDNHYLDALLYVDNITDNILFSLSNADKSPYYKIMAGLYNYAAGYGKRSYWYLYPYFLTIPSGNEKKGIKQLLSLCDNPSFLIQNEANYFLMRIYYEAYEDYQNAALYCRKILQNNPDNLVYRALLYQIYTKMEKPQKAENQKNIYYQTLEKIKTQLTQGQYQYLRDIENIK